MPPSDTEPTRKVLADAIFSQCFCPHCKIQSDGTYAAADAVIALYSPTVSALALAQKEIERLRGVIWETQLIIAPYSSDLKKHLCEQIGHKWDCKAMIAKFNPCTCGGIEAAP